MSSKAWVDREVMEAAMAGLRKCGDIIDVVGQQAIALIVTVTLHSATPVIEANLLREMAEAGGPG